ncbi:hypothetical protein F442_02291 [Phytophthora nicotianae P10297]|uniref:Uncharacterized protein n=3 Tax=Phytophthora nicotianae TaxID=4792 RepID=W3A2K0_PHYNI|nr:hypothetical protein L915_02219 [Phytophthora nicotianae]ETP52744.1 hypothetical protein F442_02291 [Phytophthora nicotianae P10297]
MLHEDARLVGTGTSQISYVLQAKRFRRIGN